MKTTILCHNLLLPYIKENQICIDATCGNGNDTLFLCRALKNTGCVLAFDIQNDAINNTKEILDRNSYTNYKLFNQCHTKIKDVLIDQGIDKANLIMFNLGFLPGGEKSITTETDKTMEAIKQAIELLEPNGILSVMVYPGHFEGSIESSTLDQYMDNLTDENLSIFRLSNLKSKKSPYLIIIEKRWGSIAL